MGLHGICTVCRRRPPVSGLGECSSCYEYRRLLEENLTVCPPRLNTVEFQRLMRKVAVHAHATRLPEAKEVSLAEMETRLTDVVLQELPLFYVSLLPSDPETARKNGFRGSYTFKAKIPREVVFKALEKTRIWDPEDPIEP